MRKFMDIKNANSGFDPENYQISLGTHRQLDVIWLRFPYNENLIKALKNNTPAKWSTSQNAWYLPDNHHYRKLCNIEIGSVGKEVLAKISDVNMPEFLKFQNMLVLKGYSANTIRTYSIEFAQLLYLLKNLPVHNLTTEKLQSNFLYCHEELKLSESVIHSRINAIKFYFEQVLHQDKMFFDIPRPKKPLQLPKSLNTEEVKKLFEVTENIKHRLK